MNDVVEVVLVDSAVRQFSWVIDDIKLQNCNCLRDLGYMLEKGEKSPNGVYD